MNRTAQYIFQVLDVAGITISDFARLTGISRQSLYHWKKGGKIADGMRLNIAYNWAIRIEKAVQAKRLPITQNIFHVKERVAVLKAAILG